MAMQAGIGVSKILFLAGAGYTGTIFLKNGKMSDLLGELMLLVKRLEKSGDQSDGDSEYTDAIASQVRRLANEVRQLALNRPINVLNSGQTGNLSSLVVPVAALGSLGYGYIWWKGLSFSDLMYVTKRSMEKAVLDLTKKLLHASDIIADAKKHLTQRIQHLDDKMLKQNELARSVKDEVVGVRNTITNFHEDLGILQQTVETLDLRLSSLSWKQDYANHGLAYLIDFVNGKSRKMPEILQVDDHLTYLVNFQQEQMKLPGKSPSLLTYAGSPNLKGLKDIVDTFSAGIDQSASDLIMQNGMDKLEQRRPLLRATSTRC